MSDIDASISGKSCSITTTSECDQPPLPDTLHSLADLPAEKRAERRPLLRGTRLVQSRKWSRTETARFYQLLYKFGTDFLMIATEFSSRSKKEILVPAGSMQNKYKKECALNKERVAATFQRNHTNKPLAALQYAQPN